MKHNEEPLCPLSGKFYITAVYTSEYGGPWVPFRRYVPHSESWDFFDIRYDRVQRQFEGKLRESGKVTEFSYVPRRRELVIECSYYTPEGFCDMYAEELYTAERLSKNHFSICQISGPDDDIHLLKIELEKR